MLIVKMSLADPSDRVLNASMGSNFACAIGSPPTASQLRQSSEGHLKHGFSKVGGKQNVGMAENTLQGVGGKRSCRTQSASIILLVNAPLGLETAFVCFRAWMQQAFFIGSVSVTSDCSTKLWM